MAASAKCTQPNPFARNVRTACAACRSTSSISIKFTGPPKTTARPSKSLGKPWPRCEKIAPVTSLQPPYSLIRRQIENEILPHCERRGIGVIVYSPMASGILTGAMTRERIAKLPEDDWRRNSPELRDPRLSKNLELVERLKRVAARYKTVPGAIAVAWALRLPAVTGAIVGARNAQQAEEVMRAGEIKLTPQDIAEIEGTAAAQVAR